MNAVWIALEDINDLSGPFHIYKRSHKYFCEEEIEKVAKLGTEVVAEKVIEENRLIKIPAIIKKGSILVWNSYTLHGSENPKDEVTSRKSITAHYYPIGARVNLEKDSIKSLKKDINSLIKTQNSDLYILNSYENNLIRFMKNTFMRYLKDFWRKNLPPISPMKRSR
jgi:phytanoyl-CoA hydroxylase